MNDMSTQTEKPSLGVGSLIGETFGLFFRNFVQIFLVLLGPSLLAALIGVMLVGADVVTGQASAEPASFSATGFGLWMLVNFVAWAVMVAAVVHIAYSVKSGQPVRLGDSLALAARHIVPIVCLTIVASIAYGIGFMLLVIPGLWLYAVWSVITPAIVVEGAGFRALGRSAALTKDYRWPIVGALVLLGLCTVLFTLVLTPIVALVSATVGGVAAIIVHGTVGALPYGLFCVMIALLYARLREIKEGVSVSSIAEVFT